MGNKKKLIMIDMPPTSTITSLKHNAEISEAASVGEQNLLPVTITLEKNHDNNSNIILGEQKL